jgi:hypothetical protein
MLAEPEFSHDFGGGGRGGEGFWFWRADNRELQMNFDTYLNLKINSYTDQLTDAIQQNPTGRFNDLSTD